MRGRFGVGLRPVHYEWVLHHRPAVDWFEIISENFMGVGGRPRSYLERVRASYPVAMHGVGLSIAGTVPLQPHYLKSLKDLVTWLAPMLVSDHLCWTSHRQGATYDLLPFPYTEEALRHIGERVDKIQEYLGRQILLENPSHYLRYKASDYQEAEFLNELCRRSGCGILLDLNNLVVNRYNLGDDPWHYLDVLDDRHVRQFHLAGHHDDPYLRIDTHDHPISDEVLELYRYAARRWQDAATLVEWDDAIPEFADLLSEVGKARNVWHAAHGNERSPRIPSPLIATRERPSEPKMPLDEAVDGLFDIVRNGVCRRTEALFDEPKPEAFQYYHNAYVTRVHDALAESFPLLAFVVEEKAFAIIASAYRDRCPPEHFSLSFAGLSLSDFLRDADLGIDFGVPQWVIADIAAVERARAEVYLAPDGPLLEVSDLLSMAAEDWPDLRLKLAPSVRILTLGCDLVPTFAAFEAGATPDPPEFESTALLVYRCQGEPRQRRLDSQERLALEAFQEGREFVKIVVQFDDIPIEEATKKLAGLILEWVKDGIVGAR